MTEKAIKVSFYAMNWCAKANNMKDKNKEQSYLKYWDVNNLCR